MNNYTQPYFGNPGMSPYGYSPVFQNMPQNQQQFQKNQMQEQYAQPQPVQQAYKPLFLQGKSVDSIDVVKAMDIPLDGSTSYFPLTDGSAIVTKQLQPDGTSKTIVYRPESNDTPELPPKYITEDKLEEVLKNNENDNIVEFRKNIKDINRKIEDITSDISEIRKSIKDRKDK